jgi:hypothetical protein
MPTIRISCHHPFTWKHAISRRSSASRSSPCVSTRSSRNLAHNQAIEGGPDSFSFVECDSAENRKVLRNFKKFRGKSKSSAEL